MITALTLLVLTAQNRAQSALTSVREKVRDEEGLTTLEMAIWGAGLFAAAVAAVLIYRTAITTRTSTVR